MNRILSLPLFFLPIVCSFAMQSQEELMIVDAAAGPNMHNVNFHDIPIVEFIRYASKVSGENFIFNNQELDFNVTFSSGKSITSQSIVRSLLQLLRMHDFQVTKEEHSYLIYKSKRVKIEEQEGVSQVRDLSASLDDFLLPTIKVKRNFHVYKLQYQEGGEIVESLKKIAADLSATASRPEDLLQTVQGMQWVKATNSLLFSGMADTIDELQTIIASLDVPLKQVFIEVLVIETDVKKGLEYGLQWASGGKFGSRLGFGTGNFSPGAHHHGSEGGFANVMKGINATNTPQGLSQVPTAPGFDLGVIGDIIMHKGRSYLSLGSLVSALQADGESTIVLNQKIITQDNKNSKIFVGDNIPFTGSVVQTIGQGQQTTANIEYRDVGVSLSITPMLGEADVITLDIDEEITEAVDDHDFANSYNTVAGIRTTKTNMLTHVHVPDKHFLVLSGMIRNAKTSYRAGIPCLGSLPAVGALFSKNKKRDEKRNIIIFVRPQIIHSFKDYQSITAQQEHLYESQADGEAFIQGVELVDP